MYETTEPYGLLSLFDVLSNNSVVTFSGDSVTNQIWDGAICHLAKQTGIELVSREENHYKNINWRYGPGRSEIFEFEYEDKMLTFRYFHVHRYVFESDMLKICNSTITII
eukprot:UN27992